MPASKRLIIGKAFIPGLKICRNANNDAEINRERNLFRSFSSARNAFSDDSACFKPLVSSFVSARNFTLASLLLNQSPSLQHLFFCICLPRFICIFIFQDRKQGIIFRIPKQILADSIHNHVIDVHIFHSFNFEPWKS